MRFITTVIFILSVFINSSASLVRSVNNSDEFYLSFADSLIQSDTTFVDSVSIADSLQAVDTTQQAVKVDTLKPLQYNGISRDISFAETILKEKINKLDYRYTGDLLNHLPFSYTKNLGWYGQPNETMLYGLGFGGISFMEDGVPINNRLHNSLDLNFIQSEFIDSLEIVPLPLGFFYGSFSNPVSVNFITRDKIAAHPYTRIRFRQAPEEEGFIDGIFNAYLMNRLNVSFEFTNGTVDPLYENSESSKWQFNARIRYMPNNIFNIIGSYSHVKAESHLNGGVDLSSFDPDESQEIIDEYIYDPLDAQVVYTERYQKTSRHNFSIKVLGNLIDNAPSDLTIYHQTNLTEFRQNESGSLSEVPVIIHDNKYIVAGVAARQKINLKMINLDLNGNYENVKYSTALLKENATRNLFSLGGRASFNLINEIIKPSLFLKTLQYSGSTFFGYGADVNVDLFGGITFYAGYSTYDRPINIIEEQYLHPSLEIDGQSISTLEAGAKIRFGDFYARISYFKYTNDNSLLPVIDIYTDTLLINEAGYFISESTDISGINAILNFNLWNIYFSNNASYYISDQPDRIYSVPEFTLSGGVYYVDTLFNDNLKLKTGINYKFYGIRDHTTYDFEMSSGANYFVNQSITEPALINSKRMSPSFQLDFVVAGTIQDAAIVYLVFENILNSKYFLVPNYPMFGPAFRIGVAWEFLD
ncbi:putative porin [Bacteroidota bacterium]